MATADAISQAIASVPFDAETAVVDQGGHGVTDIMNLPPHVIEAMASSRAMPAVGMRGVADQSHGQGWAR